MFLRHPLIWPWEWRMHFDCVLCQHAHLLLVNVGEEGPILRSHPLSLQSSPPARCIQTTHTHTGLVMFQLFCKHADKHEVTNWTCCYGRSKHRTHVTRLFKEHEDPVCSKSMTTLTILLRQRVNIIITQGGANINTELDRRVLRTKQPVLAGCVFERECYRSRQAEYPSMRMLRSRLQSRGPSTVIQQWDCSPPGTRRWHSLQSHWTPHARHYCRGEEERIRHGWVSNDTLFPILCTTFKQGPRGWKP
jgi:hypothetical protein